MRKWKAAMDRSLTAAWTPNQSTEDRIESLAVIAAAEAEMASLEFP